jgi:hypothetical protein
MEDKGSKAGKYSQQDDHWKTPCFWWNNMMNEAPVSHITSLLKFYFIPN